MTDSDGRKFEYMKRLEYHDISHLSWTSLGDER